MNRYALEQPIRFFLACLLFFLPFQTIFILEEQFLNGVKWEYGTLAYVGTEAILWLSVVLFIVWYLKISNFKFQISNFSWTKDRLFLSACLFFILYVFASVFWAGDSQVALQQAFHILEAFLLFFMLFLGPLSFRSGAIFFVAGATLQSVMGIWQFFTQSTVAFKWLGLVEHPAYAAGTSIVANPEIGRWLRAYGSFSHPNVFGGFLVISIFLTVILLVLSTKSIRTRLGLHVSLLLQTAALFFTFSRSAWLACLVGFAVFCFFLFQQKKMVQCSIILPSIILFSIFLVLYAPVVKTRFAGVSYHEVQSTSERVSGYEEAMTLFRSRPILGVGAGNYTRAAYALHPDRPGWEYQPVHSVPLLMLVELGSLGVLLFLLMIVSFLRFQEVYARGRVQYIFLSVLVFLPVLLLDHYLFSSYIGLLLVAITCGFAVKARV